MTTDLQFELTLLRRQMTRLRIVLSVVVVVATVSVAALIGLGLAAAHRGRALDRIAVAVDSLDHMTRRQQSSSDSLEVRVQRLRERQLAAASERASKADDGALRRMRARLDELASRLAHADSAYATMDARFALQAQRAGEALTDSLSALRTLMDGSDASLRAATDASRAQLAALELRMDERAERRRRGRVWTALRDAATVTGLSMIAVHSLDHTGR